MAENYTEIKTITRSELYHYVSTAAEKQWTILRVEPWWDTDKMLADMRAEVSGLTMRAKDPEIYKEFYAGISIQYTNLDETEEEKNFGSLERNILPGEPIYRNSGVLYFTREGFSFTRPPEIKLVTMNPELQWLYDNLMKKPTITCPQYINEWAKAWPNIMLDFAQEKIMFTRGRYLKSSPKQYANRHSDGECRIHFPIWTNDKCFFSFFEDKPYEPGKYREIGKFNLPADGAAYLFNAHANHSFGNFGDEDRTHAVFGLQLTRHIAWEVNQPELKTFEVAVEDFKNHLLEFKKRNLC